MLLLGFYTGLILSFCLLLTSSVKASGPEAGPTVVNVVVKEGEDAVLPCSISTRENIAGNLFDWKKDGQKEVFMYKDGDVYSNGRAGQDEQFKGRVSHFSEQLEVGNASIIITDTKPGDSGNYTCDFPHTRPRQRFNISLVVEHVLKNRSEEIPGAASEPFVAVTDVTEAGVVLQCVVQCASPKPTLLWKDAAANVLPAEEPRVSERGGRYSVVLQTTVTKTTSNRFYCEAKQEQIGHVVTKGVTVPEKLFDTNPGFTTGFLAGFPAGVLTAAAAGIVLSIVRRRRKGDQQQNRSSSNGASEPLKSASV